MGKIISFSGIDGSGKTTIINKIQEALREQGKSSRYVWLRYNHYLTKFLLGFCRFAQLSHYNYINGVRVGYHEFYRSRFISCLFILSTYIDTLIITAFTVYLPSLFSQSIIICDRWVYDIMVDLEVDTGISFAGKTFSAKAFKKLVPQRALCFLIQRDFQTVRRTRAEHAYDRNFPKRFQLFERQVRDPNIIAIDNNRPIDDVTTQLLGILS